MLELQTPESYQALINQLEVCKSAINRATFEKFGDTFVELFNDGVEELLNPLQNLKLLPVADAVEQLRAFFENDSSAHAIYVLNVHCRS